MEKILQPRIKIINVVSRKGGVGKTTLALNLARLLLNNGNLVLYFDLDLTGTQAHQAFSVLPCIEDIHDVKYYDGSDEKVVNLPNLFDEYLNGHFATNNDDQTIIDFKLDIHKINLFNSYLITHSYLANGDSSDLTVPSVLFDDLHSKWFIEFLIDVINSITHSFQSNLKNSRQSLFFILDNAPGYSNYEPDLEDFLTEIGPENGKFLFVSSLDSQDLEECVRSIKNIYQLFNAKLLIGDHYKRNIEDEAKESGNFNDKNLETILKHCSEEFYEYYLDHLFEKDELVDKGSQLSDKDINRFNDFPIYLKEEKDELEKYLGKPENFIQIILNKVPLRLKKPDMDVNLNLVLQQIVKNAEGMTFSFKQAKITDETVLAKTPLIRLLNNIRQKSIYYNSDTEIQFIENIAYNPFRKNNDLNKGSKIKEDFVIFRNRLLLKFRQLNTAFKFPISKNSPKRIINAFFSFEDFFIKFQLEIISKNRENYYKVWDPQYALTGSLASFIDVNVEDLLLESRKLDLANHLEDILSHIKVILKEKEKSLTDSKDLEKLLTMSSLILSFYECYSKKRGIQIRLLLEKLIDFILFTKKSNIESLDSTYWIRQSLVIREEMNGDKNNYFQSLVTEQIISPYSLSHFFKLLARFQRVYYEYSLVGKTLLTLTADNESQIQNQGIIREVLQSSIVNQSMSINEAKKVIDNLFDNIGSDILKISDRRKESFKLFNKIDILNEVRKVLNNNIMQKWQLH